MSATAWSECPKCGSIRETRSLYGKVTEAEFIAGKQTEDVMIEETLREDYICRIRKSKFETSYEAECTQCGFKYSYKYQEEIEELKESNV
jgi:predicted RNA-binding Zn-ribbon protein involved in translation (DUF1610 family)